MRMLHLSLRGKHSWSLAEFQRHIILGLKQFSLNLHFTIDGERKLWKIRVCVLNKNFVFYHILLFISFFVGHAIDGAVAAI